MDWDGIVMLGGLCGVLGAARIVTLLAGVVALALIARYDMTDVEGGLAFMAIAAQTLAVAYFALIGDAAEIRVVQDVSIIMLYVVIVRAVLRGREQREIEDELVDALLRAKGVRSQPGGKGGA